MSSSFGNVLGNSRWSQGEDGQAAVEICIPIVLPAGARPKELQVVVKDTNVLCVIHKESKLLQWRLYAAVGNEVEWRVDENNELIVDLEKKSATTWPCLLSLPMGSDDPLIVTKEEFDKLFARHLPPLPSIADKETTNSKKADGGAKADEEDMDKLLDEAANEVLASSAQTPQEMYLQAELENYEAELAEISAKIQENELKLQSPTDDEATKKAQEEKTILEFMMSIHNRSRELRTHATTLESFLTLTQLEIQKARANIGSTTEEETENYTSDVEKELTPHELMVAGLKYIEDQEIVPALHLLRLAAIHHNHEQSIMVLYSIYSQLGSPRGAHMLLRRALDDDNVSEHANLKVGELFDTGAKFFVALFPAALFFYQRAAKLGNVHAMLAVAQLYLRGSTSSTLLSEEERESLVSNKRYHAWLQQAIDRGCGSAFFVRGCMHLKGEHGMKKSFKAAKEYLDMAAKAQPEVLRRAPQIMALLEKLRMEEEGTAVDHKVVASPQTRKTVAQAGNESAAGEWESEENGEITVTSSLNRLNALGNKAGSAASAQPLRTKKTVSAASSANSKAFWERAATFTAGLYALYTLAFPLRIIVLPQVYTLLGEIVERIPFLANPSAQGSFL